MEGIEKEILTEDDLFPSRIVEFETMIEQSAEFDTWETIIIESGIETGPRRMILLFFNNEKSLMLQYIFWAKKLNYLFVRRRISAEVFHDSINYIKERLEIIEEAIERSIRRENIPGYHKEALILLLHHEMDKALSYRNSNVIDRTRMTRTVFKILH